MLSSLLSTSWTKRSQVLEEEGEADRPGHHDKEDDDRDRLGPRLDDRRLLRAEELLEDDAVARGTCSTLCCRRTGERVRRALRSAVASEEIPRARLRR